MIDSFLEAVGLRQRAYQQTFAEGSHGFKAIVNFAHFCGAFRADAINQSNEQLREMNGRRQAFFYLWDQLNFAPHEMETIAKATRLADAETRLRRAA